MNNLTESARIGALKLVLLQFAITLLISVICGIFKNKTCAISLLIGGGIGIVGTGFMALCVFSYQGARAAKQIVKHFYRGEALKLLLTAILFAITFITVANIEPLALLGGFILVQSCYWVSPWLFATN